MLELKHLAPYLPYGLRIKEDNCEFEMTGSFLDEWFNWGEPMKGKPILRPLSDLRSGVLNCIQYRNTDIEIDTHNLAWTVQDNEVYYPAGDYEIPFDLWYGNYEKLLSEHYDIFRLIEKNLAIDINTITNE